MRWTVLLAMVLALAGGATASASLPKQGLLVPGRSLGGVRLGESGSALAATLGGHSKCSSCRTTTWYFTYKLYDAHGLAVELTKDRVSGIYTLWQPPGWRGPGGLALGASEGQVVSAAGPLVTVKCSHYDVLVRDSRRARTAYYIADDKLYAFGLFRRGASPCR
jgi:hypothetical protein